MKNEIKSHWHAWVFYITIGIVLIIAFKALDSIGFLVTGFLKLIGILSPFLFGLLIAYLLYIPERKVEGFLKNNKKRIIRKHSRKISILITYLIALLIIILIINVILPVLIASVNELVSNVPSYYSRLIETYNSLPDDSVFKTEQVYNALKELQNFDLKQYINIEKITQYIKGAVGVARGVFDVFVAVVVSIYILSERNQIFNFLGRLSKATFKESTCNYIEKYFYRSNGVFFKFISSQFIDAIVVGVLTTIAMSILKVKYASLLGFTIGLFNMIPYFGAIVAVMIASVITFITGGFSQAIIMLIVVVILQQIDANVINPKIIGDSLKISPLLVILSVTIGGAYFGIIGMFLGVPVAAVLKILVNDYIDSRVKE